MIAATPASSNRLPSSKRRQLRRLPPSHRPPPDRRAHRCRRRFGPGCSARGFAHEVGVAHRRRADDHASDAFVEPAFDSSHVANAAAELHRHLVTRPGSASTAAAFIGCPAKAPSRSTTCRYSKPLPLEISRLGGGIVIENGRLRHVAMDQTNALAVFQIDCRKQDHGRHLRKLPIKPQAHRLAFFGMKLRPDDRVAADDRRQARRHNPWSPDNFAGSARRR